MPTDLPEDWKTEEALHQESASTLPTPWATWAIMALCVGVFAAMYSAGKGDVGVVASRFGAKDNALLQMGEWRRLLLPIFLHGSILHLGVNMLSLHWMGTPLERFYGTRKFILIFIYAGVVSFAVSYWRSPYLSLGASGAIFGLVGAGLVFPLRFRRLVPERVRTQILSQLLTVAAVNLAIGFSSPHIDNWAHIGGLLGGAFIALFLIPNALDSRPTERGREFALTLSVLGALGVLVFAASQQVRTPGHLLVPQEELIYLAPRGEAPWWRIGIPKTWKQTPRGWKTPSGALFLAVDSRHAPRQRESLETVFKGMKETKTFRIGEFLGRRVVIPHDRLLVEYVMVTVGRDAVILMMESDLRTHPFAYIELNHVLETFKVPNALTH